MLTGRHDGRVVYLDIDLGLGRRFGYLHPARAELIEDLRDDRRPRAECHPDRPHHAHGKCQTCYQRDRRNARTDR